MAGQLEDPKKGHTIKTVNITTFQVLSRGYGVHNTRYVDKSLQLLPCCLVTTKVGTFADLVQMVWSGTICTEDTFLARSYIFPITSVCVLCLKCIVHHKR
ncbi:hypothetical protein PILCRDRAFT_115749 [Piloderma croceum F 1598]|uniref:Uncharacterized protein n=1 Tax=Piloderma croceum (strain F 1598) TaxID=765440 RepID=A0A0C3GKX4_PILCF|nr:hypothetical protein PILCRDRAFT_115749 [Piloderma croceum F 1598]